MGILSSLNWFKSEKQKELEALLVENQKVQNELLNVELDKILIKKDEKPYKKVKLVNDTLTIVLNDGAILTKPNAKPEDFHKVRMATFEWELFNIATSSEGIQEKRKEEQEVEKVKVLIQGIEILKQLSDFTVEDNTVYLKGINRSLPQLLVEKFASLTGAHGGLLVGKEEEYEALKRFFMWCCLNPRAEVADKLYDFLVRNSFRITKQGFFVALRNVVTIEGDNSLVKFVSETYNKVKAVWKKKPSDYYVWGEDDGTLTFNKDKKGDGICKFHGNLEKLYKNLPEMKENRFTDAHTRTFDIRIGQVVNMPPEECNWSTADCAHAGLHFTADQIHYVGCGDTSVLTLINPMKVVGIGESKGRCYEYLPIMTVPTDEATKILHDVDFDTLELDEDFAIRELENLAVKAAEGFAIEAKKHSFNIPSISSKELTTIVLSLDDMKNSISKRINVID